MKPSNTKLHRIERLLEIDEMRLDVISAELAAIESKRSRLMAEQSEIVARLELSVSEHDKATIQFHSQAIHYSDYLQSQLESLQQAIDDVEQEKASCVAQAVKQKTKIRGWQTLLKKLQAELAVAVMQQEIAIADEQYLSKQMGQLR